MKKILLLITFISSYSFSAQASRWVYCCSDVFSGKPIHIDTLNITPTLIDSDSAIASVWISTSNSDDVIPENAEFQLLEFKIIKSTHTIQMRSMSVGKYSNGDIRQHRGKQVWDEITMQSNSGKISKFVINNLASRENK